MKHKPILFIDMDGTIAEWRSCATFEDLLEENYYASLMQYKNVVEAIKQLNSSGIEICILSAYLVESKYAFDEKCIWLNKYLPYIKERLLCPTWKSKAECVRDHIGQFNKRFVLLDDYSKNLHEWKVAGGTGIKLLNGINGTQGTWKGPSVSRFMLPENITEYIKSILDNLL